MSSCTSIFVALIPPHEGSSEANCHCLLATRVSVCPMALRAWAPYAD